MPCIVRLTNVHGNMGWPLYGYLSEIYHIKNFLKVVNMCTQFNEWTNSLPLDEKKFKVNLSTKELVDEALRLGRGKLTNDQALYVETGEHTGRAAKDKYVVSSDLSEATIDWENNIRKMSKDTFESIKRDIFTHLSSFDDLYLQNRSVGADDEFNMNSFLVTSEPQNALFMNHMFREAREVSGLSPFTIYHAPHLKIETTNYDIRSNTVIAMDMDSREVLIAGTRYAGEIKKSIFSAMNYILPEKGLLPMHAGANCSDEDVSVFFGLSGTGKTTLSTDTGRKLIGDDEHGLGDKGIFNFEGGCYAKTFKLSKENEPEIFQAAHQFGSMLENVIIEDGEANFDDNSLSENGRVSYPLKYIPNIVEDSRGGIPNNVFFLCADAFGVLPAISKLNVEQAKYYFLSGYTAKLAGTEVGVKEPQATFSTCFGAPFMMRAAKEYASLLENYIKEYEINVWLVNTGWTAGPYGEGYRFPIKVTRGLIRSAQAGELIKTSFRKEEAFGLSIPENIDGIDSSYLNPKDSWSNKEAYDQAAMKLANMFKENFKKY